MERNRGWLQWLHLIRANIAVNPSRQQPLQPPVKKATYQVSHES
jgi:hypothetical protein